MLSIANAIGITQYTMLDCVISVLTRQGNTHPADCPPKPEVILTNYFAEPTVLLVPITSRDSVLSDSYGVNNRQDVCYLVESILKLHSQA
jgi:hypothetical protein